MRKSHLQHILAAGIVTLLFGPSLDVGARQATTRCQMLRNEEWIALTESAYDTSMLQAPVCGRRLKIGHMATFRHVPLISDFGIMNTTLAHALADIECSGILGDLSLEVVPAASDCNQKIGMRAFLNLLYESNVAMIIGPECSVTTELVALVASSVKLPILAYSTESPSLSDRDKYDTYFRLNQPGTRHGDGWQLLLEKMDISTVSIIRETGREFDDFVRTFENSIRKSKNLSLADSQTVSEDDFQIRLVMDHVERANARVVVAQVYSTIAQKLLCEAIRRNLTSCCGDSGVSKILFIWPSWFTPLSWLDVTSGGVHIDGMNCSAEQLYSAAVGSFLVRGQDVIPMGNVSFPYTKPGTVLNTTMEFEERIVKAFHQLEKDPTYRRLGDIAFAGFLYDALWTAAYSLRGYFNSSADLKDCMVVNTTIDDLEYKVKSLNSDANQKHRERLKDGVFAVNFTGVSGSVSFNINSTDRVGGQGEVNSIYDNKPSCNFSSAVSLSTLTCNLREVGEINADDQKINLNFSEIVWGTACGDHTCLRSYSSLLKAVVDDSDSCGRLEWLAGRLGSCGGAIAFTVILPTCAAIVCVFVVVSYLIRYKYKRKYLNRSVSRLKQFGLKQNEAYALLVPDKAWEVDRKALEINRKLGEGAFGTVYGADYFSGNLVKTCTPVAVKTLHDGAEGEEKTKFFLEIQLMKKFEHDNVVHMIGVCTTEDPMYIIMELMLHGDLRGFLLGHRHLAGSTLVGGPDAMDASRLTRMSRDIALGLQYLHSIDFIHRDLAARNCMVTTNFQVKIGDFGMARDVKLSDYYRVTASALLPVRWMARESLLDGVFTSATDMWSYGVVLFEIMTFGALPYPGKENGEVMQFVRSGRKMALPPNCPDAVASLLFECWDTHPKSRPTAESIVNLLTQQRELLEPCVDVLTMRQPNPLPISRRGSLKLNARVMQAELEQGDTPMDDTRYVDSIQIPNSPPQFAAPVLNDEPLTPYDSPLSGPLPPDDIFTEHEGESDDDVAVLPVVDQTTLSSEPEGRFRKDSSAELIGNISD